MKTIEEKAEAYDKALEIAKKVHKYSSDLAEIKRMEEIFPELRESEDEKVMKKLIHLVKKSNEQGGYALHKWEADEMLAWLEKVDKDNKFLTSIKVGDVLTKSPDGILINLGKSDRALEYHDKVKLKFKVGDWIVDNRTGVVHYISKIKGTVDGCYYVLGYDKGLLHIYNESDYHLWTIRDAKDGDILHSIGWHNDCIFIFNGLDNWRFDEPNGDRAVATGYCCLFVSADKMEFGIQGPDCIETNTVKPATKEQRNLLFQKMHEAGYEWDANKKELKQIEQKPMLSDFFNAEYERGKADALQSIEWSEEDKDYYDAIIAKLEVTQDDAGLTDNQMEFLKSLKQRIGG